MAQDESGCKEHSSAYADIAVDLLLESANQNDEVFTVSLDTNTIQVY
jgi:hypothetical protein